MNWLKRIFSKEKPKKETSFVLLSGDVIMSEALYTGKILDAYFQKGEQYKFIVDYYEGREQPYDFTTHQGTYTLKLVQGYFFKQFKITKKL